MGLFDEIYKAMANERPPQIKPQSEELQMKLDKVNRELLSLLTHPERLDAGALSNFVTYSRRLKDKLVNFAAIDSSEAAFSGGNVVAASIDD